MPQIILIGQVFPECYQMNFSHPPIDWTWEEKNLVLNISIEIKRSKIEATCNLNTYKPEYLSELHKRIYDLTKSAINIYSFNSGIGFQITFSQIVDDKGNTANIATQDLSLSKLCKSFSMNQSNGTSSYDTIWKMVVTDPGLFQALDDLIVSISIPHQSSVNCARALEGLRRLISPTETNDATSWKIMRDTLHIERDYLQFITDTSLKPRHGDREFIAGEVVTEVVRRSWIIMDRFIHFRKGGNEILPIEDFPILRSTDVAQ